MAFIPVFMKKVYSNDGNAYATAIGSGAHVHFNNASSFVNAAGGTVIPTGAMLGPIDLSLNGGADLVQLVGAAKIAAVTGGTAVTACSMQLIAYGETEAELVLRGSSFAGLSTTTAPAASPAGETFAVYSALASGSTPLTIVGGNTPAASRGTASTGFLFGGNTQCNAFPLIPDGTDAAISDQTVFSAWVFGPGSTPDGSQVMAGINPGLSMFKRMYVSMKFIPSMSLSITSITFTSLVIGAVGYRDTARGNPVEHNVIGCKPANWSQLDFAL